MAKKAANTTSSHDISASAAGAAPKKTTPSRAKKHLKAQAVGVAAAVEGFVHAIVSPAPDATPEVEKGIEQTTSVGTESLEAPIRETAPQKAVEPAVAQTAAEPVTREDIARLAYAFFEERGGRNGSPAEDWLRAEKALSKSAGR